jgi:hypothetical protein
MVGGEEGTVAEGAKADTREPVAWRLWQGAMADTREPVNQGLRQGAMADTREPVNQGLRQGAMADTGAAGGRRWVRGMTGR